MADKKPAAAGDTPMSATVAMHVEHEGVQYPALLIKGEAPRKGSTVRVTLENGVTYAAKVVGTTEADGETLVETEGLEPITHDTES